MAQLSSQKTTSPCIILAVRVVIEFMKFNQYITHGITFVAIREDHFGALPLRSDLISGEWPIFALQNSNAKEKDGYHSQK